MMDAKTILNVIVAFLEGQDRTEQETIDYLLTVSDSITEEFVRATLLQYQNLLLAYGHTSEATFEAMNQWTSIKTHDQIINSVYAILAQETQRAELNKKAQQLEILKQDYIAQRGTITADVERISLKLNQSSDADIQAGLNLLLNELIDQDASYNVRINEIDDELRGIQNGS